MKKEFLKYVSLNVLGMIGLSCYILADTFFVARGIGADGLTALNLALPVYSFIHGSGLMVAMGGATRYSISKSKYVFTQSCCLAFLLACLFFTIGALLHDPLAMLLGTDESTHEMTSTYLKTILLFAPMFICNNLIICFVRNDGNPKLSMAAMLLGSFSNIILDYLFIFPMKMGMFGAALATGIAPVVSLLVLSVHFMRKKNAFGIYRMRPQGKAFADIFSLGVSSLITEFSSGIVMIIFNSLILSIAGNTGVAAYGIIANIALVVLSIFTGISQGMQPLISNCFGSGDWKGAKKLLKYGLLVAVLFAAGVYVFSMLFAQPMVNIFNREGDLQLTQTAIQGLAIYFISFLAAGINIVHAAYHNSVDRPGIAFTISMMRGFIVIVPAAWIFSACWSLTGIWISMPFTEIFVLLFSIIWMVISKKRKIKNY